MLRRPTTFSLMTVPFTGRELIEADAGAPSESVRRVTLVVQDAIRAQLDQTIDDIARSRGIAWPMLPAGVQTTFYLMPQQTLSAISHVQGLAQCTVITEYFSCMPGDAR